MTVSDVGTGSDTQELLGALAQIVEGLQNHQTSADMLFSLSDVPGQQTSEKWQLPPIEQAVAAIRIGQGL
jgi:hypothetical protein